MSINQSINQYYCDNFHVQNLFPEYLYLVGEIFTSRSPSDPDVETKVSLVMKRSKREKWKDSKPIKNFQGYPGMEHSFLRLF